MRLSGPAGPYSCFAAMLVALPTIGFSAICGAQDRFPLGVAAGDVRSDSVILWTRPSAASTLDWEISTDSDFFAPLLTGEVRAGAETDFTVRASVSGLTPGTAYFYRFVDVATGEASAVAQFRTAPAADIPAPVRFAFSGDTNFQRAPFYLMSDIAAQQPDLFIWFGDVIYADVTAGGLGPATTLDEYRAKYRQVRGDEHARAALHACALWAGWDDHEVGNDYAGLDPNLSRDQLAAAEQAFFEYIPVERSGLLDDPNRTFRSMRYGAYAEFFFLDERQYRDEEAVDECKGNVDPDGFILGDLTRNSECRAVLRADRSLLGDAQRQWIMNGLLQSDARWKFVINNVPLSYLAVYPYDRWDGYDEERRTLLEFIDAAAIDGVVFLTTDIHGNGYNPDLGEYFRAQRPDYELSGIVPIREFITGPLGNETAHESLTGAAPALLRPFVELLETRLLARLREINGLAFIDINKVSYALFEVDETGELRVRYRGVPPTTPSAEAIEFFDTAAPPQPPACGLGVFPVLTIATGLRLAQRPNRVSKNRAARS